MSSVRVPVGLGTHAHLRHLGSDRGAGLSEPPITLFWGSPADFLAELLRRLEDTRKEEAPATAEPAGDWF